MAANSEFNELEQDFFRRGEDLPAEEPEDFSDLDDGEERQSLSERLRERFVEAGTALIASLSRS